MEALQFCYGGAPSIMAIAVENKIVEPSSNPGRDCVSLLANALGQGMDPSVSPSQILLKSRSDYVRQPIQEKEDSEFKPVLPPFVTCHILIMLEGFGKYIRVLFIHTKLSLIWHKTKAISQDWTYTESLARLPGKPLALLEVSHLLYMGSILSKLNQVWYRKAVLEFL